MTASAGGPTACIPIVLSERGRRWLAALVLGALALGTLLTIADAHAAAWDPAHGHVFRHGVAVPHDHPWDASVSAATRACFSPAGAGATAGDGVVFTPSADALAGASIASPILAGAEPAPCRPPLTVRAPAPAAAVVAANAFAAVPTPPPRG